VKIVVVIGLSIACTVACRSAPAPITVPPVQVTSDAGRDETWLQPRPPSDASVDVASEGPVDAAIEGGVDASEPVIAPVDAAPPTPPRQGMAVPRGSRGRCVAAWFNCACSYVCRWEGLHEMPGADCANACASQPAPDIRCTVVDGWCGPVPK